MVNNKEAYDTIVKNLSTTNDEIICKVVDKLIEHDFDINYTPEGKKSLLQLSVEYGFDNLFKLLVQNRADINVQLTNYDESSYLLGYDDIKGNPVLPKIADLLVSCKKYDLLYGLLSKDCQYCLDGTILKLFEQSFNFFKLLYVKDYFKQAYSNVGFKDKNVYKKQCKQNLDKSLDLLGKIIVLNKIDINNKFLVLNEYYQMTLPEFIESLNKKQIKNRYGIDFDSMDSEHYALYDIVPEYRKKVDLAIAGLSKANKISDSWFALVKDSVRKNQSMNKQM